MPYTVSMVTRLDDNHSSAALIKEFISEYGSLRDAAEPLVISHTAVSNLANAISEPTPQTIAQWIFSDDRRVRRLGLEVFAIKYDTLIKSVLAPESVRLAT